jgi:molecular chaperone GrpE (heat shock protein)
MSEDFQPGALGAEAPPGGGDIQTLGASTLFNLLQEMVRLRESNNRQHTMFQKDVARIRDDLKAAFNSFAADTQRAYQQLRQEIQGEKKFSMALLMILLELGMDLEHLVRVRPAAADADALNGWMEAVGVQSRKIQAALKQHGIVPYDAPIGSPYNPALHERVGSARFEGLGPLLVGEQKEPGYASQLPDFKLVRAKVIVSE